LASFFKGVGHPATSSIVLRLLSVLPAGLYVSVPALPAIGVGQPANLTASCRSAPPAPRSWRLLFGPPDIAFGVGHPTKSLADVRRADARNRQIGKPAGISCCFQVSSYSGAPFKSIRARNLLSKEVCRATLGDKTEKSGPEVSFVGMAFSLSSARKRLTRAACGPDGFVIGPSCEAQGEGPSADAGEEVRLGEAAEVIGPHFQNAAIVHHARGDQAARDQLPQPRGGEGIELVVVCGHAPDARLM
jgi:hypothetical protein